jgi:hypothetical protein
MQNILNPIVKIHEPRRASDSVRRLRISSLAMTPDKPIIRLHGMWLYAAGFRVADEIHVHVQENRLVIQPVSRLVARRTVHIEQRRDLISHSDELPGSVSDRIIWSESDQTYINP